MPTAITARIYEDATFEEYLWAATRGLNYQRWAEGEDLKTYKFKVEPFYAENIKEAQQYLEELQALTPDEIKERAAAAFTERHKSWVESREGLEEKMAKLDAMLVKVDAWEPPSEDHVDFKGFMLRQIEETKDFDFYDSPEPQQEDANEWYATQLEVAAGTLQNAIGRYQEALKSVKQANVWFDALRVAVPPPE
jgi:hypothetical protein